MIAINFFLKNKYHFLNEYKIFDQITHFYPRAPLLDQMCLLIKRKVFFLPLVRRLPTEVQSLSNDYNDKRYASSLSCEECNRPLTNGLLEACSRYSCESETLRIILESKLTRWTLLTLRPCLGRSNLNEYRV